MSFLGVSFKAWWETRWAFDLKRHTRMLMEHFRAWEGGGIKDMSQHMFQSRNSVSSFTHPKWRFSCITNFRRASLVPEHMVWGMKRHFCGELQIKTRSCMIMMIRKFVFSYIWNCSSFSRFSSVHVLSSTDTRVRVRQLCYQTNTDEKYLQETNFSFSRSALLAQCSYPNST